MRFQTPLVASATLILGFAVARATGVVWLGGVVLVIGGLWCARQWWRALGILPALLGVLVYFVAFVASHPFAKVVGAWPSTVIVAFVAGALACLIEIGAARRLDH
jgi:hypothetical protein